jgi:hypothetical protein
VQLHRRVLLAHAFVHPSFLPSVAQGAEEMAQMEHLLNVYASRVARGHVADFLGYCEVAADEASARLTQGLWLVRPPVIRAGAVRLPRRARPDS